jgi:hypothetical protein
MVIGNIHEHFKELLSKIVNAITLGLNIHYLSCGATTWRTERRGLEADLSYYFDLEKIRTAREALARKSMDSADYPAPDLAVEIDISHPQVDRPAIYKDLRVGEIWRYSGGHQLVIEHLQPDGSYAPAAASRFLRVRVEDIVGWLMAEDTGIELDWTRRLMEWASGLGRQEP